MEQEGNRMILIPDGEKVRLCDMDPGLFLYGDDCLAVKTEYITDSGRIEAYIVSTGEYFHGGAKTAAEQRILMVQPLKVEPLVRCKDCAYKVFDKASQEYYCNHPFGMYGEIKDNDFCSDGERRNNG
jgi:DNA-directed RNA polymerase subunit RPC12/RpoP